MADLHAGRAGKRMTVGRGGVIEGWRDTSDWLSWDFKVFEPGEFEVKLHTAVRRQWRGGHKVKVTYARQRLRCVLKAHETVDSPRAKYWPEAATRLGTIVVTRPGTHQLKLRAKAIEKFPEGLAVAEVRLAPVR